MDIMLVRWRSHEDLVGKQLSTGQLIVKNGNLEKKKNFLATTPSHALQIAYGSPIYSLYVMKSLLCHSTNPAPNILQN